MKRYLSLLLSMLLVLGVLAGCNGTPEETQPKEPGIAQIAMESGDIQYCFMTSNGASVGYEKYTTYWGDSCLIAFPDGKVMLIDTGIQDFYPILKDRLTQLGVSTIDYMVFSHPHNDHCGGAWKGLFDDFTIDHVYHNGAKNLGWSDKSHIASICEKYSIPCTAWKAGDTMEFGLAENPVKMQVLWPTEEAIEALQPIDTDPAINSLSLVMRFDFGAHSSLFTGDIYQNIQQKELQEQIPGWEGTEEALVKMYTEGQLDVDLLKMPHHGNPLTSNSTVFLSAVRPKYAVATGFSPVGTYLKTYKTRGMTASVFFDRMHGYISFQASSDGKLTPNIERTDYLPDFGKDWNESEKIKK